MHHRPHRGAEPPPVFSVIGESVPSYSPAVAEMPDGVLQRLAYLPAVEFSRNLCPIWSTFSTADYRWRTSSFSAPPAPIPDRRPSRLYPGGAGAHAGWPIAFRGGWGAAIEPMRQAGGGWGRRAGNRFNLSGPGGINICLKRGQSSRIGPVCLPVELRLSGEQVLEHLRRRAGWLWAIGTGSGGPQPTSASMPGYEGFNRNRRGDALASPRRRMTFRLVAADRALAKDTPRWAAIIAQYCRQCDDPPRRASFPTCGYRDCHPCCPFLSGIVSASSASSPKRCSWNGSDRDCRGCGTAV
jgi:hypothetical protein